MSSSLVNSDLNAIHEWTSKSLVTFNPNKTESVLFSRKNNKPVHPLLYMNHQFINEVTNHKLLGLIFFTVKLLTEHHLDFLSLKGGCTDSSKSTLVKMSHCLKSHAAAHIMGLDARKPVCRGLRTAQAQTSLHIRAV